MKDIIVLAIESSCDETSVAVIKNGNEVLSNIVSSQIDIHKKFGGVVPEVASRHHVENITLVLDEAMKESNVKISDITCVAVTKGPGLIGSLLVGINAAKAFAFSHNLPIVGVHHIAGHIFANNLVEKLEFPLLALVVSGGHTELVIMEDYNNFNIIGQTRDDAVGEAYDKVARVVNLPYPGGPQIDRLAKIGEETYKLPRVMLNQDNYDFSFSGLKSAVINLVHNAKQRNESINVENLAKSFQESVVDILAGKTIKALNNYKVKQLLLAGGVAANSGLRARLQVEMKNFPNIKLIIPPLKYCTDNAAMIGVAGTFSYLNGTRDDLSLNGKANLDL